ncbi:MAG: tetratricopeptide repeat protein [Rhizobiales bacterium]|nr:tetratricopeptide repeat protein [Hyphomicrobiales bacterium]
MMCGAAFLVAWALGGAPSSAATLRGEAGISVNDGFARLVLNLDEATGVDVRLAGHVVIVSFKQPVYMSVEGLAAAAPSYVTVARSDPDGRAIRLGLKQKVSLLTTSVGEKVYVDLLPQGWQGPPPALPHDAVENLTTRLREAERKLRQSTRAQGSTEVRRSWPPIKVRVATSPTFTRYVFDLPEGVAVTSERGEGRMELSFNAPLKLDLADVKASMPPTVAAIDAETEATKAVARFDLIGRVDVRTFRDDNAYVMDVTPIEPPPGMPAAVGGDEPAKAYVPPALKPSRASDAKLPAPPVRQAAAAVAPSIVPPVAPKEKAPAFDDSVPPYRLPQEPASTPAQVTAAPPQQVAPKEQAPVIAALKQRAETLRLVFPFQEATAAAVFRRADTLWLVFDSAAPLDVSHIRGAVRDTIGDIDVTRSGSGQVVRLKLVRPKLSSFASDGLTWVVTLGDTVLEPTTALGLVREEGTSARVSVSVPFEHPATLHRISDPDVGDKLLVVTGFGPARGFLRGQDFVEFRTLASTHGIVVQPLADDLAVDLKADRVSLSRPAGLMLSASAEGEMDQAGARTFDGSAWISSQQSEFVTRQSELVRAAAEAPTERRASARLGLAQFYMARAMYPEAKAVLDVTIADTAPDDAVLPAALVLRGVTAILSGDDDRAMKDLSNPAVGNAHHAPLWRAIIQAHEGHWVEANEGLRSVEAASADLPVELQRVALREAARASLEVGDAAAAARRLNEFDGIGVPDDLKPTLAVLNGRVAEKMGRSADAIAAYHAASEAKGGASAAQGALREIALRYATKDLARPAAIDALEKLTASWRGDETENEALQLLARLYGEEGRYRESFQAVRVALDNYPETELTRKAQETAGALFETVFLGPKGEALAPLDALALFYDFNTLTPIGRRGDEMIRRLAERLVSVDLLSQAAKLLQHQVDNRLQGAARAQIATRLATIYLMDRKPERALDVLRSTRVTDLPNEWRSPRLMIEARALAETGRQELALEVIANLQGREVERLRADIDWTARKWRAAAEQIERMYGERWRDTKALDQSERTDILRAAIGYALSGESLSLDRFRQKYLALMSAAPEKQMFDVVTAPQDARGSAFREAAKTVSATDTLSAFLRDMHARYPDKSVAPPADTAAPRS